MLSFFPRPPPFCAHLDILFSTSIPHPQFLFLPQVFHSSQPNIREVCTNVAGLPLHTLVTDSGVQIDIPRLWWLVVSHTGQPMLYFICHYGLVTLSKHLRGPRKSENKEQESCGHVYYLHSWR